MDDDTPLTSIKLGLGLGLGLDRLLTTDLCLHFLLHFYVLYLQFLYD